MPRRVEPPDVSVSLGKATFNVSLKAARRRCCSREVQNRNEAKAHLRSYSRLSGPTPSPKVWLHRHGSGLFIGVPAPCPDSFLQSIASHRAAKSPSKPHNPCAAILARTTQYSILVTARRVLWSIHCGSIHRATPYNCLHRKPQNYAHA